MALINTEADAPSDSCEALPAVMKRPGSVHCPPCHTGSSAVRLARVVSARLHSSCSKVTVSKRVSPLALSTIALRVLSGASSRSNRPAACAWAVRIWLCKA
ncbi:hypothetical protein D3C79_855260 [compost metagenome]